MSRVELVEVGPRDGLQNEKSLIPTAQKIKLVDSLSEAGFRLIEATSFVSPKWVPQLGDAAEVMAGIQRKEDVRYIVLTPNKRGLDDALAAGIDEIAVFGAATEGFSQHNINCSVAESLERFRPVVADALAAGVQVRGYISVVVHCPYEGAVAPEPVLRLAEALLAMGCYEVSLGDTTGQGTADTVCSLLDRLCAELPADRLAGHFHDTNHQAIANVMHALDYGLRRFDSAISGLGGCPYAPGAKGNVNTKALHDALAEAGWQTGLDRDKLTDAEQIVTAMGLNKAECR